MYKLRLASPAVTSLTLLSKAVDIVWCVLAGYSQAEIMMMMMMILHHIRHERQDNHGDDDESKICCHCFSSFALAFASPL
jgi:hypothetical protein